MAKDTYFGDYEPLGDEEVVDLSEWDVYMPGIDSDDDINRIEAARL